MWFSLINKRLMHLFMTFVTLTENYDQSNIINDNQHPLFETNVANLVNGQCQVICFSPDHNKSLPYLSSTEIEAVVNTWQSNYVELSKQYAYVNIFENKVGIMNCYQPQP